MHLEIPDLFIDIFNSSLDDLVISPKRYRSTGCPLAGRRGSLPPQNGSELKTRLGKWFDAHQKKSEQEQSKLKPKLTTTITRQPSGDVFCEHFDLRQFEPSEIALTMEGNNTLVVAGNHELKSEDGHYERHEYRRKVTLPENAIVEQIKCRLDDNGQLLVNVPLKKEEQKEKSAGRTIPIEFVKKPKTAEQQEMALD